MRDWLVAIFCSIAIIFIVILLVVFGSVELSAYSTDLAVGLTLLIVSPWVWVIRRKFRKKAIKETGNIPISNVPTGSILTDDAVKRQEPNYSSKEEVKSVSSLSFLKPKVIKSSIYLPNENEQGNLSFDNTLLDEIYEKTLKRALSAYSDCKLSCFSIQVYPYQTRETDDSIIKSDIIINMSFYSKNADKISSASFF